MAWLLKWCPRCDGDVYVQKEDSELTATCVQCGFERSAAQPMKLLLALKAGYASGAERATA